MASSPAALAAAVYRTASRSEPGSVTGRDKGVIFTHLLLALTGFAVWVGVSVRM